ncbi:alpha/beta hydrolase [Chitinimonas viridis]|uniref:Alpha/beta hydrolase n=1 Tax=Chitinimonas viridis TaxID=664880 RepID=A0ABT8B2D6_9NEIS|nr:alpha/beta hydrolase [Chitinimonas viridis]MDN3575713.1 alpha/beta hydrolase [Chitinimonas viridis]
MNTINTADGTTLFFKDWGQGQPVLLLSGWPLSADSWDDQALVLAEAGYRVVAYDRRGFGRSSQPWWGYDYDTLADDLCSVMSQLDLKNVTLVGFSMGGGEVARYMSRHAGKSVEKAVLISSVVPFMRKTPDNPEGVDDAVFDEMSALIRADRPAFFEGFFKTFFGKGQVSQATLDWAQGMAMQAGLKGTLACVRSFGTTDFREDLSAFTVPALIIHGTEDQTVPIAVSARAAAKAMPSSVLLEYEGAAHGLFVTDKQRLSRDLLQFLRE